MIPVTQTKVVVRNSAGEQVVYGNCYAAAIASMMELPIEQVPNVEVFFHIANSGFWNEVMHTFINSKDWELCNDQRFKVFHDDKYGMNEGEPKRIDCFNYCTGKCYLVSGKSVRGVNHICIYQNGKLVHDPHPTREGLLTVDEFQTLEKVS